MSKTNTPPTTTSAAVQRIPKNVTRRWKDESRKIRKWLFCSAPQKRKLHMSSDYVWVATCVYERMRDRSRGAMTRIVSKDPKKKPRGKIELDGRQVRLGVDLKKASEQWEKIRPKGAETEKLPSPKTVPQHNSVKHTKSPPRHDSIPAVPPIAGMLIEAGAYGNLRPDSRLTVYHGTRASQLARFVNGFDATKVVSRLYGGPKHRGLFVAPDFKTAERFSDRGRAVVELEVRAKNLHGTDYSGRTDKQQQQDKRTQDWLAAKFPNSFRPYLSLTLEQSPEPQALLVGLVSPAQVKRIFYRPHKDSEGRWYTRSEFLALGVRESDSDKEAPAVVDMGFDLASTRYSLDEYLRQAAKLADVDVDRVKSVLTTRATLGESALVEVIERLGFEPSSARAFAKKFRRAALSGGADDDDVDDRRRAMRGKPLGTVGTVTIYRACAINTADFSPMDYVTESLRFAKGHAEHQAVVEEEPQHVVAVRVPRSQVYHAPNPGELFYDGPLIKGRRVLVVKP